MKNIEKPLHFEFSLETLNHLGRGLYRSFATVIAEAVSNAWDAEATRVSITVGKDKLIISDNGKGMSREDFQSRFLKVGYSRREDKHNKSKRNVIGRKGIGKLAMLSISDKVTIRSKRQGFPPVGGKIDNSELDKRIKSDGQYNLGTVPSAKKPSVGTEIIFEKIKSNLNSEDMVRKYLATQFNFIFSLGKKDKFEIFVNGKKISEKDLRVLNDSTQFIWYLESEDKKRTKRYKNLLEHATLKESLFRFDDKNITVKGFIASVKFPKDLLLRGSGGDFKASINLFCNGRLRQEDLFQEISRKELPEEYLYGEVHVDGFEDDEVDRFTSAREGIVKSDPLYQAFLKELKKIQSKVIANWNAWRRKHRDEADIHDGSAPKYELRLRDSQNWREKDFEQRIDSSPMSGKTKLTLKESLRALSYNNTLVYQDLFILENIFREYIKLKKFDESHFNEAEEEQKGILDTIRSTRGLRKSEEETHSLKGKIVKNESYLNYADIWELAAIIDLYARSKEKSPKPKKHRKELCADIQEIRPVRNPIMHTNEITEDVMNWPKIKNVIDYIDRIKDRK